jgi:hypothetical protein
VLEGLECDGKGKDDLPALVNQFDAAAASATTATVTSAFRNLILKSEGDQGSKDYVVQTLRAQTR